MNPGKLPRSFYQRPTLTVAEDLLGKILVRRWRKNLLAGRIVEVEAYLGDEDPASHAFRGRTPRNDVMFWNGGHLYVYFTYGMHYCSNTSCEEEGVGAGVLLRALEPEAGRDAMAERRGMSEPRLLCSGPARLAQALGIGREHNGLPVWREPLAILPPLPDAPAPEVLTTARIGVRGGDQKPWRFVDAASRHLSRSLARTPILPAG
jgi:DNA-3-methyladenine glycosylase